MPYTPIQRSSAQLLAAIEAVITANASEQITGTVLNNLLQDLVVSVPNLISQAAFTTLSEHDPTRAYVTGMCCVKSSVINQAISDNTGAFNQGNWKPLTGVIVKTYAELLAIKNANALDTTIKYYISDRSILASASSVSEIDDKVSIVKRVPNYFSLTNLTGPPMWTYFDALTGSGGFYVPGQRVCYGGRVYNIINDTNLTSPPPFNPTDYTLEALNTAYYTDLLLQGKYDLASDYVYEASDKKGNIYNCSKTVRDEIGYSGQPALDTFAWGYSRHSGNVVLSSVLDSVTFPGEMICQIVMPGCNLQFNYRVHYNNELNNNTYMGNVVIGTIEIKLDGSLKDCTFENGARLDGGVIESWNNFTFGLNWTHDVSSPVPEIIENKRAVKGFNNVEILLDLADAMTEYEGGPDYQLDLQKANKAGIIRLFGAPPVSSIEWITNQPEGHVYFIMASGAAFSLTLNVSGNFISADGPMDPFSGGKHELSFLEMEYAVDASAPVAKLLNWKLY